MIRRKRSTRAIVRGNIDCALNRPWIDPVGSLRWKMANGKYCSDLGLKFRIWLFTHKAA